MKRKRLFIIVIILLVFLSTTTAIAVRMSLVDDIDFNKIKNEMNDYIVNYDNHIDSYGEIFNADIDSFEKLQKESQFILEVKLSGTRKNLYGTVLSEVEVLNVYKGDTISKREKIYLYEPSSIYGYLYYCLGGYNLMNNGNEYMVYINELKVPNEYDKTEIQEKSYMFTSLQFSKFNTETNYIDVVYNLDDFYNGDIKYKDIKDMEFIPLDRKTLEIYNNIKKQSLLFKNN